MLGCAGSPAEWPEIDGFRPSWLQAALSTSTRTAGEQAENVNFTIDSKSIHTLGVRVCMCVPQLDTDLAGAINGKGLLCRARPSITV